MNLKDYRLKHYGKNWVPHAELITKLIEEVGNKKPSGNVVNICMLTHSNEALEHQKPTQVNGAYRYLELLKFMRDTPKIEGVESIIIKNKKGKDVTITNRGQIEYMLEPLFDSFHGYGYNKESYDLEIEEAEKNLPPKKSRKPEKAFFIRYCKRRCKEIYKAIMKEYPYLEISDMCILIGKILYTRGLRIETYGGHYNPFAFKEKNQRKNFIRLIKSYLK